MGLKIYVYSIYTYLQSNMCVCVSVHSTGIVALLTFYELQIQIWLHLGQKRSSRTRTTLSRDDIPLRLPWACQWVKTQARPWNKTFTWTVFLPHSWPTHTASKFACQYQVMKGGPLESLLIGYVRVPQMAENHFSIVTFLPGIQFLQPMGFPLFGHCTSCEQRTS